MLARPGCRLALLGLGLALLGLLSGVVLELVVRGATGTVLPALRATHGARHNLTVSSPHRPPEAAVSQREIRLADPSFRPLHPPSPPPPPPPPPSNPKLPEGPVPGLDEPGGTRRQVGRHEWSPAVTAFVHFQGQGRDEAAVTHAHAAAGDDAEWRRAFDDAARLAGAAPPPDARGTAFLVRTVDPTDAQLERIFHWAECLDGHVARFVLLVDTSLGDAVARRLDALAARRRARLVVMRTGDRALRDAYPALDAVHLPTVTGTWKGGRVGKEIDCDAADVAADAPPRCTVAREISSLGYWFSLEALARWCFDIAAASLGDEAEALALALSLPRARYLDPVDGVGAAPLRDVWILEVSARTFALSRVSRSVSLSESDASNTSRRTTSAGRASRRPRSRPRASRARRAAHGRARTSRTSCARTRTTRPTS